MEYESDEREREESEEELYSISLDALAAAARAWTSVTDSPRGGRVHRINALDSQRLAWLCHQCGIPLQAVFDKLEKERRHEGQRVAS